MVGSAGIYAALDTIFRDLFDDDALTLTPQTTADQVPGWDSMKMVSIILAVERQFAIRLRSRDVDRLKTVGDLAELVRARLG